MKNKRFLSVLLVLCLLVGYLPTIAMASDTATMQTLVLDEGLFIQDNETIQFTPAESCSYSFFGHYENDAYAQGFVGQDIIVYDPNGVRVGYDMSVAHCELEAGVTYTVHTSAYTVSSGSYFFVKKTVPVERYIFPYESISGKVGDTKDVEVSRYPSFAPFETVTYTSSDESVAYMDGTKVVMASVGTAVITASSASGATSTMEVNVKGTEVMTEGYHTEFEDSFDATFTPTETADYVFYATYGYSIVTIYDSDGQYITDGAVGEGNKVVVTLNAGESYAVEVFPMDPSDLYLAKAVPADAIFLSQSELQGFLGAGYQLEVVLSPEYITVDKITVTSDNEAVVTVRYESSEQMIYIQTVGAGTANITATTETGLSESCVVTVIDTPEVQNGYEAEVTAGTYYYRFTPEETGTYYFYTTFEEEKAEWGPLYVNNAYGEEIVSGYGLVCWMAEAGETYLLSFVDEGSEPVVVHVEKEAYAESVNIGFGDGYVCYVGDTIWIDPFFLPHHAIRKYTAASSDETVAKVTQTEWETTITMLSVGTVTLTVTAEGGAVGTCVLNVIEMPAVSVDEKILIGEGKGYRYSFTPEHDGVYDFHTDAIAAGIGTQIMIFENDTVLYSDIWGENSEDYLRTFLTGGVTYLVDIFYNQATEVPYTHWITESSYVPVESIEIAGSDTVYVPEGAYENDNNDGMYYFDMIAAGLQITINYTDGTSETVPYDATVNGFAIENDWGHPTWNLGETDTVTFRYLNAETVCNFVVVENPVQSIEITAEPTTKFEFGNSDVGYGFTASFNGKYYFYPECYGGLEGLVFTIYYTDGTSETASYQDFVWSGEMSDYPIYKGHVLNPLVLNGENRESYFIMTEPGEVTMILEYMGAMDTYTVRVAVPHVLTKVDAVEPTYTTPGNKEYYTCSHCDKLFEDADALNEITDPDSVLIPQLVQVEDNSASVSAEAVDKAIEEAGDSGEVVLPLDDPEESVTSAELPVESLETIADMDSGVTVEMSYAEVSVDNDALNAIVEQAEGETVTLNVEQIPVEDLNDKQQSAMAEQTVLTVISAQIICGENTISDFNGGTVTIRVPFAVDNGANVTDYAVLFVADDGTVETVAHKLENGCIVFSVEHFSEYVVVELSAPSKPQKPVDPENPATGDMGIMLFAALFAVSASGVMTLTANKKHWK